jgi:hypothetical protein
MKDIIDLGNMVFDRLIQTHGEIPESRMLFLYGITTNTKWTMMGSDRWVLVHADGVTANFDDPALAELSSQWLAIRSAQDQAVFTERLKRFREEYEKPAPKDGDTFNFWSDPGTFREIRL